MVGEGYRARFAVNDRLTIAAVLVFRTAGLRGYGNSGTVSHSATDRHTRRPEWFGAAKRAFPD